MGPKGPKGPIGPMDSMGPTGPMGPLGPWGSFMCLWGPIGSMCPMCARLRARELGGGDFLGEKLLEGVGNALRWAAFDDAPIWHAVA